MKHVLLQAVAGCGLLIFGLSANAQSRDRDDHWRDYRQSDRFYKGRLFERVRTDLERIQASTFPGTEDKYRLVRAKQELNELQSKFDDGNYDATQMQDVMAAMDRVLADNRLSERDRDNLQDDKARLREFRERHERDYPDRR
jgi:hypothetical protein